MNRILDRTEDYKLLVARMHEYTKYLESERAAIGEDVLGVALTDWYYNFNDPRCPHDSWLRTATVTVADDGRIDIKIKLLGAFHDLFLEFTYRNVTFYDMPIIRWNPQEWAADEFEAEGELRAHKVRWTTGEVWKIAFSGEFSFASYEVEKPEGTA